MPETRSAAEEYPNAVRLLSAVGELMRVLKPHLEEFTDFKPGLHLAPRHRQVLLHLSIRGATSVSEIAKFLGSSLASTSQTVSHLAELGYVKREEDPDDHRRTLVRLSGQFEKISKTLIKTRLGPLEESITELDTTEFESTLNNFSHLRKSLAQRLGDSPTAHPCGLDDSSEEDSQSTHINIPSAPKGVQQ